MEDLCIEPPPYDIVKLVIERRKKQEIVHIATTIAAMLGHKKLYFMSDIYDIFLYLGDIKKVTDTSRGNCLHNLEILAIMKL